MDDDQRAKLDSYDRVQKFNEKYATDVSTIPDYSDIQTDFDAAVAKIKKAAGLQAQQPGAESDAALAAKKEMGRVTIQYALRGSVKARRAGNITLSEQLNEPVTYITASPKVIAVERAQNLRDYMNNNLATLTNISAANIGEIDAAIRAYNDIKDDPTINLQTKKGSGTEVLPGLFKEADGEEDSMFSLLRSYFQSTNIEIVNEMHLAMELIKTGVRHTTIDIKVVAEETGEPLTNASIKDDGTGKPYEADDEGNIHLGSHRNGKAKFIISSPGRQSVTMTLTIVRGTANKFTIALKQNGA